MTPLKSKILERLEWGWSTARISAALGCSKSTVYGAKWSAKNPKRERANRMAYRLKKRIAKEESRLKWLKIAERAARTDSARRQA